MNNKENELVAAVTALAVDNRNAAAEEVLSDWRSKLAAEPTEEPLLVENCFTSI